MQIFDENFTTEKEKLTKIANDYQKLCELLTYEEVLVDKKLFLKFEKQKNALEPLALKYQELLQLNKTLQDLQLEVENLSGQEKELFVKELEILKQQNNNLFTEIKKLLNNYNAIFSNIIIEVNADKNENSQKLLEVLLKGYKSFCTANNLSCNIESNDKKATLIVAGYNAKQTFKNEIGVHICSTAGACQVFVCETSQSQFFGESFKEEDVLIQTCRSSGAGGQHVNTTDSSIRALHTKTGLTAVSQDERSQFQNKQKALERLKQKVEDFYTKSWQSHLEKQKKEQLKLMKNGFIAKNYDFKEGNILKANKQIILVKDFLQGKDL